VIAFLTLCYCGVIWLLFFKLKVARFDMKAKVIVVTIGVAGILALLIAMNLYQPYSTGARVSARVIPMASRVEGRILSIEVEPNVPVKKGDVLFRIDPEPYQARVDRLEAMLAEAVQAVPQLEAAWDEAIATRERAAADRDIASLDFERLQEAFDRGGVSDIELERSRASSLAAEAALEGARAGEVRARLAYESEIDGENTTVARVRAELRTAEINLRETVVYAPADGFVTQLFAVEGSIIKAMPVAAVMTFVYEEDTWVRRRSGPARCVTYGPATTRRSRSCPARSSGARCSASRGRSEGAVTPSSTLRDSQPPPTGPVWVQVRFAEDLGELRHRLCVAIYTEKASREHRPEGDPPHLQLDELPVSS
jgi:hypothetical protein